MSLNLERLQNFEVIFIDSLISGFSDSIYRVSCLSIVPAINPAKLFNHTLEVFTLCKTR